MACHIYFPFEAAGAIVHSESQLQLLNIVAPIEEHHLESLASVFVGAGQCVSLFSARPMPVSDQRRLVEVGRPMPTQSREGNLGRNTIQVRCVACKVLKCSYRSCGLTLNHSTPRVTTPSTTHLVNPLDNIHGKSIAQLQDHTEMPTSTSTITL